MQQELSRQWFRAGVACATAGVAAFLLAQLHEWPPHEDETLALFVGGEPLDELFDTVLTVRGGTPLHFLLVHAAAAISPTLTALRLVSVLFAVASIPAVAALVARLTDRTTALVATVLVSASWVTLFHGIYGRMYSLFLFLSILSFIALLRALARRTWTSWALWGLAVYATLAAHQYGAFVLAAQVAYLAVLRLRRKLSLLPPAVVLVLVAAAAVPLWRSSLVLASRYEVELGSGGTWLGGPLPALEYLASSLGDFVAGWTAAFAVVCALAGVGLVHLWRRRTSTALLALLVLVVPTAVLALATASGAAGVPATRHLIFALPFFAMSVAAGLLRTARAAGTWAPAVAGLSVAGLLVAEIAWGWHATPTLYTGEPRQREVARIAAEEWLATVSRPGDVLFGYDPLFLGARERGGAIGETVIPRADAKLALRALLEAPRPLGRGVWILDASDGARIRGNTLERLTIETRSPGAGFETRAFGPFLIVRTVRPELTADNFLRDTERVQAMGLELAVNASALHYETARLALQVLEGDGRG